MSALKSISKSNLLTTSYTIEARLVAKFINLLIWKLNQLFRPS